MTDSAVNAEGGRTGQPTVAFVTLVAIVCLALAASVYMLVQGNDATRLRLGGAGRDAQAYIGDLTRDPEAAKFRKIEVGAYCVTGEVNAKNAYGAYVGYLPFMYSIPQRYGEIDEYTGGGVYLDSADELKAIAAHTQFAVKASRCRRGKAFAT